MRAVLDHCEIHKGIVITNDTTKKIQHPNIKTFYGGHPIPNQQSVYGTEAIEHLLSHVSENDLLLVLISGGGSALLCHPRVSLEHLQQTTSLLLKTKASIQEINTIRKHLSFVKGGQLIQKVPGMVMSLIISDIIGDPISFISSGPTVADETTYQDAKKILYKYKIWDLLPTSVQSIINQGINKKIPETPNLDQIDKRNLKNFIIANNTLSCSALFKHAKTIGYQPFIYSNSLNGEAKKTGLNLIDILLEEKRSNKKNMLIAGGETRVTVQGNGLGGRNQEMVLATIGKLHDHSMLFVSCGTDGIDGMSPSAGAIADEYSLLRSKEDGLDFENYLRNNDSFTFFSQLKDTLITGPTGTNVMDIQILIC
jgi:glycerate-2-kinase